MFHDTPQSEQKALATKRAKYGPSMKRPAAANAQGVEHLHIKGERPEVSKELVEHVSEGNTFNPIVSKAQQRAMYAAAAGHSTLGIPAKVGKDFVGAGAKGGSFKRLPSRKGK